MLREKVTEDRAAGQHVSIVDLMDYCRQAKVLVDLSYRTRSMFCRRILIGVSLNNPSFEFPKTCARTEERTQKREVPNLAAAAYQHVDKNVMVVAGVVGDPNDGKCGCHGDCLQSCLNQGCYVECTEQNCSAGPECGNRWVGRCLDAYLQAYRTEHTGYGLRCAQDIEMNTVVVEYCGEYITKAMCDERMEGEHPSAPAYFMSCGGDYIIDARVYGNLARFVNHACKPNLNAVK